MISIISKFSSLINALGNIGYKLSKVPMIFWMIVYGIIIIVFAVFYSLSPKGLYHNYAYHEKSFEKKAVDISQRLKKSILNNLQESRKTPFDPNTTWIIDYNSIDIYIVDVVDGLIEFTVNLYAINTLTQEDSDNYSTFIKYFTKIYVKLKQDKLMINDCIYIPVDIRSEEINLTHIPNIKYLNYNCLFNREAFQGFLSIKINQETDQMITDYLMAYQGYPYGIDSGFQRMLYFSVVTITTLGYGDIVPISSYTRFLVGTEATLGVLVLGLMLNSLTDLSSKFKKL